mgnify:CR=1 FL=1
MSIATGLKLKLIRESLNLSQVKFCEMLDLGLSGYKKYELGSEPGGNAIKKIANHPKTKMYFMWLFTDETNPDAGQIAPGDFLESNNELTEEEFEKQFIEKSTQALMMFFFLGWFVKSPDKDFDIEDCSKSLLKELRPVIQARVGKPANSQKTA